MQGIGATKYNLSDGIGRSFAGFSEANILRVILCDLIWNSVKFGFSPNSLRFSELYFSRIVSNKERKRRHPSST